MPAYDNLNLYKSLKELGVIDPNKLEIAYNDSQKNGQPLANILLDRELILDENLGQVIAQQTNFPYIQLSKITIGQDLLHIIPEIVARRDKIIAFARDKDGLKVAMADPTNTEIQNFISKKTGEKIIPYFATERDLLYALRFYQKEMQSTFNELLGRQVELAKNATQKEAPVAKLVDRLIEYAYENKSSDIHIEPTETSSQVRFRIDGILHDVVILPNDLHAQIISRIKVLSKLRIDEHQSAQDGKMQINLLQENLDIRVSIVPIVEGEKAVLRLLSSRSRQFALSELGMYPADIAKVKRGFEKPYGMVLSTGPTGSGKTTTIYAIKNPKYERAQYCHN